MSRYRKVRAGEPLEISAGLYNDVVDLLGGRASGFGTDSPLRVTPQGVLVALKNTTGSDRARWDCMALGALIFTPGTDGKEAIIFEGETADADEPPAILQEPIAAGKIGSALIFGYTLAKLAIAGSTADRDAAPNASGHNLLPGSGSIRLLAAPSTSATTLRPVLIGGSTTEGGGSAILAMTPVGGIAARTGAGTGGDPFVFNYASCPVYDAGTGIAKSPAESVDVGNSTTNAIPGNTLIQAKQIAGVYFADVADCPAPPE